VQHRAILSALTVHLSAVVLTKAERVTGAKAIPDRIGSYLLGVKLSVRTDQVPDHALIAGISLPGFPLEEFQG